MKKLLQISAVLCIMVFANVSYAGFADDYAASHPKNVKVSKSKSSSGKIMITKKYELFKTEKHHGLYMRLRDTNGIKITNIGYFYSGDEWKFYDKLFCVINGEKFLLEAIVEPTREVVVNKACEIIDAIVKEPKNLQNVTAIGAHSKKTGEFEILLDESSPKWAEWKQALDIAIKITAEK